MVEQFLAMIEKCITPCIVVSILFMYLLLINQSLRCFTNIRQEAWATEVEMILLADKERFYQNLKHHDLQYDILSLTLI